MNISQYLELIGIRNNLQIQLRKIVLDTLNIRISEQGCYEGKVLAICAKEMLQTNRDRGDSLQFRHNSSSDQSIEQEFLTAKAIFNTNPTLYTGIRVLKDLLICYDTAL